MARTFGTSGDRLSLGTATALNITGDITIVITLKFTDTSFSQLFMSYTDVGPVYPGYALAVGAGGAGKLSYWSDGNGTWWDSTSSTYNSGAYVRAGVSITSTTGTFYKNGASDGTFTQAAPTTFALDKTIGGQPDDTYLFPGDLAELAVWSVGLNASEMAALGTGFAPTTIRPGSLLGYWKILGTQSPEPDGWKNNYAATVVGSPAKASHPRVFYPTSARHTPAPIVAPFPPWPNRQLVVVR